MIDNDADGAIDCDDDECDGGCPEDCTDGRDNDGDGLIDCEDGECATEDVCVEDCTDGIDNDGDGLTDCFDDECWSEECHPDGIEAYVVSGDSAKEVFTRRYSSIYGSGCATSTYTNYASGDGEAKNISGKVRTKPAGATTWTTCDWTVDTACGIPASNSEFLPEELVGYSNLGVQLASDLTKIWYPGSFAYSYSPGTSTAYSSSSCYYFIYSGALNVEWSPITQGTTYSFDF